MMKFRSCICPTIMPGSTTRDFSSANPNTTPITSPTAIALKRDMAGLHSLPLDPAQHQHGGGNPAGEHRGDRHGRADGKLGYPREPVAGRTAIGDPRPEQHQKTRREGPGVAADGGTPPHPPRPERE